MKRMIERLQNYRIENGNWIFYLFFQLFFNRVRVGFQRFALGVHDIYFQGTPKIVARSHISFGASFQCGRGAWIESVFDQKTGQFGIVEFGRNFVASDSLHVAALRSVKIGNDVLVGSHVLISDHSHGSYSLRGDNFSDIPPNARPIISKGGISIADNVWICDGVKILAGVSIGKGAIIAANTVVREDVPPGAIYGNKEKAEIILI
ncbi:lipopolysaccharide O-acetyltransferase [Robbsia andropogonis]|uniref:acyltransferase n=1 Tax=Robbsia andropogonis TaxID=28092 RepID=UPI003D1FFB5D